MILGRDHHDVSGKLILLTEKLLIYMMVQDLLLIWRFINVIGDSFRGATWVSISQMVAVLAGEK